jgi:hypothetical protein
VKCFFYHGKTGRRYMAAEFTFVAGDERLEVRIIGFETSGLEKENVGNRLGSTIVVSIGAFTGSFKAAFTPGDLIMLDEELRNALASRSDIVSFKNTGGDLSLSIEFKHPEKPILSGVIQPHRLPQGVLHFRLDISRAALYRTLEELENTLQKFSTRNTQKSSAKA